MSEAAKILILSLNYAPEEIGIGPYSAGLAEHLCAVGHEVRVVAGWPYYPEWKVRDGYRGWWETASENGIRVTRCPHYVPENPSGFNRLVHHAGFALSSLPVMFEATFQKQHIVLAILPSLIAAPVAWLAARLSGARLWLHVQDFEVDAAAATGLIDRSSPGIRAGRWLERALLSRADLVTTISPQMCARLAEKGVAEERIAELRNWANHLETISQASGEQYRDRWNLAGKFVALYSGNIANKQGLEVVIDAAKALSARTDIAIVVCGEGPNLERLMTRATGLTNIQFHPLQPAACFAEVMRMADCHLLPQLAEAADLVLPSKLANMLASGRPVVATAKAGTGIAGELDGCGLLVEPENAQALAGAIEQLADDAALTSRLGEAAEERAKQRWQDTEVLAGAERLVARLLDGSSR